MLIKKKNLQALFLLPKQGEKAGVLQLVIRGKNLVFPEYRKGYLRRGTDDLIQKMSLEHLTTKWFAVDASERYLIMSGDAYNRAVWQFMMEDGTIFDEVPTERRYRFKVHRLYGKSFPKVRIPEGAVKARVFFSKNTDEESSPLGERLQIEYGLIPTSYQPYSERRMELGEVSKDEVLFYKDGFWYRTTLLLEERERLLQEEFACELATNLLQDGRAKRLHEDEIELSVEKEAHLERVRKGQLNQVVLSEARACYQREQRENIYSGIYGIRRRRDDSVPVFERVYDAADFHFNLKHGDEWATPYENSFDRIYPWCAIRRCVVSFRDGKREVIYEGEEGYATDGTAGEVMVEIPKHYVRRVVENGYEEIAISAKPAEGFQLDPSFLTQEGEQDYMYVGAYFATKRGKCLRTLKNAQISIFHTATHYKKMADANVGFEQCDLCAVLTIQRLFFIETAVMDSQAVLEGNVKMPYLTGNKMAVYYSLTDEKKTNTIRLTKTIISDRYWIGDLVAVMPRWRAMPKPEYANHDRVVEKRVINEDGTVDITFSGKPVRLKAHETGISTLPPYTGGVDELGYVTGVCGDYFDQHGHRAFCYRGIENVWGGVWWVLSHCSVKDSKLYLEYPDGRKVVLGYSLPEQPVELTSDQFGNPEKMCVRNMGYDPENPLIALPGEIGDGASTSSFYCDAWYSMALPEVEYIVTYGGAWDNMGYAGIAAFRATYRKDQKVVFHGVRMMTRRNVLGTKKSSESQPISQNAAPKGIAKYIDKIRQKGILKKN